MKAIQIDPHGMASLDLVGFIGLIGLIWGQILVPFKNLKQVNNRSPESQHNV